MNFIDPWGLKAGDAFSSINDALTDMYQCYYGVTDYTQLEIGSAIYSYSQKGTTYYSYVEPILGEPDSIELVSIGKSIPTDTNLSGYVHSHASLNEKMNSLAETFSRTDYIFTMNKTAPLYLLTKLGNIRILQNRAAELPSGNKDMERYSGTLVLSGLTYNKIEDPNIKLQYALSYGNRWEEHLLDNMKIEFLKLTEGIEPTELYKMQEFHKPTLLVIRQLEMFNDYLRATGRR